MAHLTQRTVEWFEKRRGKLTASNLGSLLGLVSYCPRKDAYARIFGQESPKPKDDKGNWFKNRALQWGIDHEKDGIMAYMIKTGNIVKETGLHTHEKIPWLAGSPDGLVGEKGMIEVKCPFFKKKDGSSRVHKSIPVQYYLQMNALLEILDRDWCDYVCWAPEGLAIFRVQRDKETFQYVLSYYQQIWEAVSSFQKEPPPISVDQRKNITSNIITAMGKTVDLDFWKIEIQSAFPEPEEDSEEKESEDDDQIPPPKRQRLSDEGDGVKVSKFVSSRTRQAIRGKNPSPIFMEDEDPFRSFRYSKV